jgi:hypothetical protein
LPAGDGKVLTLRVAARKSDGLRIREIGAGIAPRLLGDIVKARLTRRVVAGEFVRAT